MRGKGSITIKDVSEEAGVAISTVSKAINGFDCVSDETRKKVLDAAERLGYVRNRLAASMKGGSSKLIVVVVPDIINEFYTSVIQGVEEIAAEYGYFAIVFSTNDSRGKENELFEGELSRIIDGAIIIPAHENLGYYKSLGIPIVIVDRYVACSDMSAVVIDNAKGSFMLTEELINAGHTDIGFISGALEFNIGIDRLNGYCEALKKHNIKIKNENIKAGSWYRNFGYKSTMEFLNRRKCPTAILAANNLTCIGCIEAIKELNLVLGKDISLVSFDDCAITELMDGGITVIKRPTIEMGRIGMKKLLDQIGSGSDEQYPNRVTMDVELIRRKSIGIIHKEK